MPKAINGVAAVCLGAAAGLIASAVLYALIMGLFALFGSSEAAPPLWLRAWHFGTTFGLLAGAGLGLSLAYGAAHRSERGPMLLPRLLALALGVLAIVLVLTGGRWAAMFDGAGGAAAVLIIAWMVMTHLMTKKAAARG